MRSVAVAGLFAGVVLLQACTSGAADPDKSGDMAGGTGTGTATGGASAGGATTGGTTTGGTTGTTAGGGAPDDKLCHPAGSAWYCLTAIEDASGQPLPPGVPVAMNDHGDVLFAQRISSDQAPPIDSGWLWRDGIVTQLPDGFAPTGLNNAPSIVGMSTQTLTTSWWHDGQLQALRSPGATYAIAHAISDDGHIAGAATYRSVINGQSLHTTGAVLWNDPSADPVALGSSAVCDIAEGLALTPQQVVAGYHTTDNRGGHDSACDAQGQARSAVSWSGGEETVLEPGAAFRPATLAAIAISDDASQVLVSGVPQEISHVIGVDGSEGARALGPAGDIYLPANTIRRPNGDQFPLSDPATVDAPPGWDLGTIDRDTLAPPLRLRWIIGFDRLGRMFGVAERDGTPAPFVLTPAGVELP